MTIALVDVGTTANDGTGDPLRTAFQTVNTALTRLDDTVNVQTGYVLLKDDSGSTGVAVTTAGDVGIGTTSPTEALDVRRAATTKIQVYDSSNTRAALLLRGSSANNSYEVRVDPSGGYSWHARGSGTTTHYEDVDAFIWRNTGGSSRRMILNGTGLGIGTTSPGEILHTLNTSAGAETFIVHQNNTGTASTGAGIRLAPSAFASGATIRAGEIVAVNDGTNVVGLKFKVCNGSNPATKMTIAGNGDVVMGDGTVDFGVITRTGLGYAIIGTQTAHDLAIRRNNVERVRLKSNTLNIANLPTSSAGLATGDLWNDGGTLKIA